MFASPAVPARLGALELVELGSSRRRGARATPFLGRPPMLGNILAQAGSFLTGALGTIIGVLADIASVPTDILTQGVDVIFTSIANVLREIPILGNLVAEAVVAAGAILTFGIEVPHLLLSETSNLFLGFSQALDATYGEKGAENKTDAAREKIVEESPPELRTKVEEILSESPTDGPSPLPRPSGDTPGVPSGTPGTPSGEGLGLDTALVAGGVGLLAVGTITALL